MKICMDAGHYGKYNQSPVNKAYYESDMSWKLHNHLAAALRLYGFTVVLTRSSQKKDLALESRGKAAKGCDLFLSIHSNACDDASQDYPLACCCVSGKADKLGQQLVDKVHAVMGTKQSGHIWKRQGTSGDYYGVLRGAASVGVPGILLEHSFHTNKTATNWLLVDANLKKMAEEEAAVIAAYYGMKKSTSSSITTSSATSSSSSVQLYRVRKSWEDAASQIGAYADLSNAKAACKTGYSVFDANGNRKYSYGSFLVKITADKVGIHVDPDRNSKATGTITDKGLYTIVETSGNYGKLKSGKGWIYLKNNCISA